MGSLRGGSRGTTQMCRHQSAGQTMRQPLSSVDRLRIAARALVCERTVIRVYRGSGTAHSRARVRRAALELGLPLPEHHQPQQEQPAA